MPDREREPGDGVQSGAEKPPVRRSDLGNWAEMVTTLRVAGVPEGALNLNVEGRRLSSPLHGFGKLWRKSYRVSLGENVTPEEVVAEWRQHFPDFWPEGNRFLGSLTGIVPGDVAVLNLAAPGGMKLSTGILVLYADDVSFTFMNPLGHMFAGFITFSAETRNGQTSVGVDALIRASDPLFEIGLWLIMGRMEDRFWHQTLQNLAEHFGVTAEVEQEALCIDARRQWKYWTNVRHNSALRSGLYGMVQPVRRIGKPLRSAVRRRGRK